MKTGSPNVGGFAPQRSKYQRDNGQQRYDDQQVNTQRGDKTKHLLEGEASD